MVMSGLYPKLFVRLCVCVCARARHRRGGVGVREFEGSVVNPCVRPALALICRGHPLSFVAGLFEVEWATVKSSRHTVSSQVLPFT